jgi:hypothetical protein
MRRVRAWLPRLAGVFGARRRGRDFDEELESHLQLHVDDNIRAGMTAQAARRAAVLKRGGLEGKREAYRDRSTFSFAEHLAQDARYTVRQLAKTLRGDGLFRRSANARDWRSHGTGRGAGLGVPASRSTTGRAASVNPIEALRAE